MGSSCCRFQTRRTALLRERLGRGRREVLLGDDEPRPGIELDDVSGVGAQVDDADDVSGGRGLVLGHRRIDLREPDLLGPDRERPVVPEDLSRGIAAEQVGRPDEPGDEPRGRPLVDLGRGPSCSIRPALNTARRSLIVSASSWSCVT